MVVCTLHIIALAHGATIPGFLANLRKHNVDPLIQAKVLRWMVLPSEKSAGYLLGRNKRWDLLIGLGPDTALPKAVETDINAVWTVTCGVSSAVVSGYKELNQNLLRTPTAPLPLSTNSARESTQNLEASSELLTWISDLPPSIQHHPVSMLNLLSFNPGKKAQYVTYGREFSQRVGSAFGGHVKVAARVVQGEGGQAGREGWDEVAFVHYPTLSHFAGMLGDGEYQAVNREHRLGALKDTFILCVVEVDDRGEAVGGELRGKL